MPRRARHYIPQLSYHLVQGGHNREPCFVEPETYRFYQALWQDLSERYGLAVHAYCLMTNHIHFLVTPASENAISLVMKNVGSRYAQYFNKRYKRTGTLWEGRHKSSLIQSERYLWTCQRYIELNPVRAEMVGSPEEYQWSSYSANAWGDTSCLKPHPEYERLGSSLAARCYAYRELFLCQLNLEDLHKIRLSAHFCQPLADDRFAEFIRDRYGIKPGRMCRGRPRSHKDG